MTLQPERLPLKAGSCLFYECTDCRPLTRVPGGRSLFATRFRSMASCLSMEGECARDTVRNDFVSYRGWYGVVPPEHERTIEVGDLGRFNRRGEFVRLGGMFESSVDKEAARDGSMGGKLVGMPRPLLEEISTSEEVVVDPFVSRTTNWKHVPQDQLKEFLPNKDFN